MELSYLEKIYNKSKTDGYFSKFDTYKAFAEYCKNDENFINLHKFLESKGYNIPTLNDFVVKCSHENKKIREDINKLSNEPTYLEKIYDKSKSDGHFSKFETYKEFIEYFKSNDDYIKLHKFLESKGYKIPSLDEFVGKCSNHIKTHKVGENKNTDTFELPSAAISKIQFDAIEKLKLPDLLKLGELKYSGKEFSVAALVPFSSSKGILLITSNEEQKKLASLSMQCIAFRLMLSIPTKQSHFYIIDNEGSGQNFSNLFGLDEKIIEKEIWDDDHEIVRGLQELKDLVPKIVSENLTTKYADLNEYNQQIPHSNQPFRFVMVANYPKGFNTEAQNHLVSLMKNGPKAGVFVIVSLDNTAKPEFNFNPSDIRNIGIEFDIEYNSFNNLTSSEYFNSKFIFNLDTELPSNLDSIKEQLNKNINESQKISVNINSELNGKEWTSNSSKGIKIPIGATITNQPIFLDFSNTSGVHHAMIGGATGSGKTVLQHDIIINGALLYSPEELQFVLMDYKEGTEFKIYESLPHVKVLSIDSKREFGLSVFDFLVNEITDRGNLFKEFNTGNLEGYCNASGKKMARILVIIDEFQVLLSESDAITTKIATLMEDVARRGRSFGINLILATQTLGDVAINTSTLNQLGLRLAMKMPENDCMRLLSVENDLPKTFNRAGQALYNANQGQKNGNIEFQVAYMTDKQVQANIETINNLKLSNPNINTEFKRYIFDGSSNAKIENNSILAENLKNDTFIINDNFCSLYIGEPAFIQEEHIKIKIRKQQESNVLLSGDASNATIGIIYNSYQQLIKQSSAESKFYIFDTFDVDSGFSGQFEGLKQLTENIKIYSKPKPIDSLIEELTEELAKRFEEEGSQGRIVVSLLNIHKFKDLRKDEDAYDFPETTKKLFKLLKDGPDYGIHFFVHAVNYNGLMTLLEQKHLKEFENVIVLKDEDPEKHTDSYGIKTIKVETMAYLKSPETKYTLDLFKTYFKT
jgi:hypothetical protein